MSPRGDEDFHIQDPLTGELIEGSVEEETMTYLSLEAQAEESTEKLWMIPFADLMSTLVILFLALFGYAYLGASSGYERAVLELQKELATAKNMTHLERQQKEAELAQALEKKLEAQKIREMAAVEISAQHIKVSLATPVLFDPSKADLKPEARQALDAIAAVLKDLPNDVQVEGHTDNLPVTTGKFKSNFELSAARAYAVIEYFIKSGLIPARFAAYGFGEFHPVADNAAEPGRAKNRRIEINIIRHEETSKT